MLSKSHQIFELLLKENLFLKKSPNQVTLVQDPNDDKTSRQRSNSRVRSYGLRQECGRLHGRQLRHEQHRQQEDADTTDEREDEGRPQEEHHVQED